MDPEPENSLPISAGSGAIPGDPSLPYGFHPDKRRAFPGGRGEGTALEAAPVRPVGPWQSRFLKRIAWRRPAARPSPKNRALPASAQAPKALRESREGGARLAEASSLCSGPSPASLEQKKSRRGSGFFLSLAGVFLLASQA